METTQNRSGNISFLTTKMPQTEILVVDRVKDPVSPASCPQLIPQEIV